MLTDGTHVRSFIEQCRDRTARQGPVPIIANLGLVNLTFYAPALDPVLSRVAAAGGPILGETRVALGSDREGLFAADPRGVGLWSGAGRRDRRSEPGRLAIHPFGRCAAARPGFPS